MGVLTLNRGGVAERSQVNRDTRTLSLDCDGDLHVMLAFAEMIRPNAYINVLGEPSENLSLYDKQPQTVFFLTFVIFHMLNVL